MKADKVQFEYVNQYQSILHPDVLECEPGIAYAQKVCATPLLLEMATAAYKQVIINNHESIIYEWAVLQGYIRVSNPIILLLKLFKHLRFLDSAPFNDGIVACHSFNESPNWRNVPLSLGFLVPLAMLFHERLRHQNHYEILLNLAEYESKALDDIGEQYSQFYSSQPTNAHIAAKYISHREFSWLPEFQAIGRLIELMGFKYMKEKQNNVEHT